MTLSLFHDGFMCSEPFNIRLYATCPVSQRITSVTSTLYGYSFNITAKGQDWPLTSSMTQFSIVCNQ